MLLLFSLRSSAGLLLGFGLLTGGIVSAADPADQRALLDRYCVTCHSDRLRTGGLTLEKLRTDDLGREAETWEKVLRKVRTGQMPPARMPRPDQSSMVSF